ncbi:MAG: dihydrolipoyl dehydrogenase family protein, partial [Gemmatimonadota bacterium]
MRAERSAHRATRSKRAFRRRWDQLDNSLERYDLIAIGGGTAGLVSAAGAAALGLRAALCEREALGGDCLWTGCVPSKALLASARLARSIVCASEFGLPEHPPEVVFATVMKRMRRERARVAEHDDPERFRKLGVEVIFGTALVTAPGEVRVADRSLAASHIVVATGAGPSVPPIEGLEAAGYLTYADAFDQDELPPRIAILGGGPIGIEFAQIYSRLGARVTVLEQLPRILAQEEPDASSALREALAAEGIDIRTEAAVTTVRAGTAGGKVVHATTPEGTSELVVDEVFVATGRRAHGAGIGLEEIGVVLDAGAVVVDRKLESAVSGIWAAGDVAGGPQFTHVAEY